MLHWIICSKNKNIQKIWQELSSYIHIKLVHAGAPSVLLFLIGKLQKLTSYCSKVIEILIFLECYTAFCFKNKNIGNIWQDVGSFIHMKDKNWFMEELLQSSLS